MLHALHALSEAETQREGEKSAIHYNRAGSKMLRLMEINGFVRYVLFCVCALFRCVFL